MALPVRLLHQDRKAWSVTTPFLLGVDLICGFLNVVAGMAITFVMALTVLDVILRSMRSPIVGTYELVAFSGAVVIGFAISPTSWRRGHIYVDYFLGKLPKAVQSIVQMSTRSLGIALFAFIGWNLAGVASDLQTSGEVSPTLQLPFYPVAYGLALACFVQCLVLVADLVKIHRGQYE